jgi:hypothetical protein
VYEELGEILSFPYSLHLTRLSQVQPLMSDAETALGRVDEHPQVWSPVR